MGVCCGGTGWGDRVGPRSLGSVYGPWKEKSGIQAPPPSRDLLSIPPCHSAGVSSYQAPPPPPLQPLGHTMALSKTLRVGVARCRGRGRYAGHWWPLAWPTWVGLEGCWAPRSGSWPQSRGLGLLPTPILSLWVICPSVPGGALEGLCWVGCTEGALV